MREEDEMKEGVGEGVGEGVREEGTGWWSRRGCGAGVWGRRVGEGVGRE